MPEIYEMLFNMTELFRLIPRKDDTINKAIKDYEEQLEDDMAINRAKLFSDFGYESEFVTE